jgi:5,5'-dehydrodivanillate O-demethylase
MLTAEENTTLTQTSAGTPMGELLRRYWWPIAAEDEVTSNRTKAVRVLGEDLVVYRDLSGAYGLLERHCPHRRADLSLGFVEDCGLRCAYHGWRFDANGACVEQPYEQTSNPNSRFRESITTTAYAVKARAGILWAYLGPAPAPMLPNWEPYTWPHGFRQIVMSEVPCNWLQAQENSIDPVHFEWLHDNTTAVRMGRPDRAPTHRKLAFEEFEHGFTYKRIREGSSDTDELWTVGRVCLWPNCLFTTDHFEWRTPIDDENMLSITLAFERVPEDCEPYEQKVIPSWVGPVTDADGRFITTHVMNQDFSAWVGQGRIADRTREHLGPSDRGIVMVRRRFLQDLDALERGDDPKAILRAGDEDTPIELPLVGREMFAGRRTRAEFQAWHARIAAMGFPSGYPFQAGQPDWVRAEYEQAMGIA